MGSEQECEQVPDWLGFRDFGLSERFDSSQVESADASFAVVTPEAGRVPYVERSGAAPGSHGID